MKNDPAEAQMVIQKAKQEAEEEEAKIPQPKNIEDLMDAWDLEEKDDAASRP